MNNKPSLWLHEGEAAKPPFQWKGCGLDDIWLLSGYDLEECDGEKSVVVRNLDGLHEAIAMFLAEKKKLLNGKEIRFLRQELDLTQSELARLLGCDAQQVARYEKAENKISGPADRLLRMLVREHFDGEVSVKDILRAVDEMDSRSDDRQMFRENIDGNWAAA
jgi:putative zinc finger/helix-turn-helix YgiT family protein